MKKKDNKTGYGRQNMTQKTTDWATRTSRKTWGEPRCSGRVTLR